jgi:hypothetical protein
MSIFHESKKSGKDYDPNPWAVCHTTVDKDEDPEKYERCVRKVKNRDTVKKTKSAVNLTGKSTRLSFEDEVRIINNNRDS